MGRKQSTAWKFLEKEAARHTKGVRVLRGADFSVKDVDVKIADLPFLQVDAKYRVRHGHHKFMLEIEEKYCKRPEDEPLMFSKTHGQHCCYATVRGSFMEKLLDAYRSSRGAKGESGYPVQAVSNTKRRGLGSDGDEVRRVLRPGLTERSRETLERLREGDE